MDSTPSSTDRPLSLDEVFEACVAAVREPFDGKGPPPIRPSTADKLTLYGLFKQATLGDNTLPAPWRWQLTEHAKWDAWANHRGMPKPSAKLAYIRVMRRLLPEPSVPIPNRRAADAVARIRRKIDLFDQLLPPT